MENSSNKVIALLGPTNTGKTFVAIEEMLKFESGIFGFPLSYWQEKFTINAFQKLVLAKWL